MATYVVRMLCADLTIIKRYAHVYQTMWGVHQIVDPNASWIPIVRQRWLVFATGVRVRAMEHADQMRTAPFFTTRLIVFVMRDSPAIHTVDAAKSFSVSVNSIALSWNQYACAWNLFTFVFCVWLRFRIIKYFARYAIDFSSFAFPLLLHAEVYRSQVVRCIDFTSSVLLFVGYFVSELQLLSIFVKWKMFRLNRALHHHAVSMLSASRTMMSALVDAFQNIMVIRMLNVDPNVLWIRNAPRIVLA